MGLLQFTTTVTGIQRRLITGGLDMARGFKKRADESCRKKYLILDLRLIYRTALLVTF
jgi:hypothetical protein